MKEDDQNLVRIHDFVLAHLLTVIVVSLALSDFGTRIFN
jgi:hypothetical protein